MTVKSDPDAATAFPVCRCMIAIMLVSACGPMTVNAPAGRLELVPPTVGPIVGELGRQGILDRRECAADRRRTIVGIAETQSAAVERRPAAGAWRAALEPLDSRERALVMRTLLAHERAADADHGRFGGWHVIR